MNLIPRVYTRFRLNRYVSFGLGISLVSAFAFILELLK